MAWHLREVRGAMHSGKTWRSALWLNAVYSGKKWWIPEYISFLNPDYVAARSLRLLRSNNSSKMHTFQIQTTLRTKQIFFQLTKMVKLNDSSKASLGARGFSFVPMSCEEYLPISLYKGVVLPRPSKTASDIRNLSHSLIICGSGRLKQFMLGKDYYRNVLWSTPRVIRL